MGNYFIGEIGELSVLKKLLLNNYEAYRVNSKIQKGWDIVIILDNNSVKRIQVKTTILQNKSTNNSFKLIEGWDFLILVVIDKNNEFNYYILKKEEVTKIKGNKKRISISENTEGEKKVKKYYEEHKDKWEKINQRP